MGPMGSQSSPFPCTPLLPSRKPQEEQLRHRPARLGNTPVDRSGGFDDNAAGDIGTTEFRHSSPIPLAPTDRLGAAAAVG